MAINPLLVSIKQASDLTTGIPTDAGFFFYWEGNELKKAPMSDIYNLVTGTFGGKLLPSEVPPTTDPVWYWADAGTYANAGGVVIADGNMGIVTFNGNAWGVLQIAIPKGLDGKGITSIAKTSTVGEVDTYTITYSDATTSTFTVTNGNTAKLPLYSAIKSANIVAGTQFIDDENGNIQYRVLAGQTLNVGELPANVVGTKVEQIGGVEQDMSIPSDVGTNISTTGYGEFYFENQTFIRGKIIKKLKFDVTTAGTMSVLIGTNVGTGEYSYRVFTVLNLDLGLTEYLVDIPPLAANESIGFRVSTDTARFRYKTGTNPIGGKFYNTAYPGGTVNLITFDLNIGITVSKFNHEYTRQVFSKRFVKYEGLKVSILCDSIGTFAGNVFPTNNPFFYPVDNVTNVNETWWGILRAKLGFVIHVNNSYSASRISGNSPSFVSRSNNLGATPPDICFVMGGINDFRNNVPLGSIDFSTAFTLTEFTDAYCQLITNLTTNYPSTKFIFLTPLKAWEGTGFPRINTAGYTQDQMADRILELCRIYGVECIDTRGVGVTLQNYTNYLFDGLHPNKAGMAAVADYIFRKL